jgi:hypothetical protein
MQFSDLNDDWPEKFKESAREDKINGFSEWPPVPGTGKITAVVPASNAPGFGGVAYVGRESDDGTKTLYALSPGATEWVVFHLDE